jgi:hypothetical protein
VIARVKRASMRIVAAIGLAAASATFTAGVARAQTSAAVVPDALKAALALVVCDDGSLKTYRTALVVASNGIESFLLAKGGAGCHAPSVVLATEPARRYPAQTLAAPPLSLVPLNNLVLAIEHPLLAVAPLEPHAFAKNEPLIFAGFPVTAETAVAPASIATGNGTVTFVSTPRSGELGSDGGFLNSTTTMASAFLVDSTAKTVIGSIDAGNAQLLFGQPPTTRYFLRTSAALIGLLQTRDLKPGVQQLSGDALTVARARALAMNQSFRVFRDGRASAIAVVLGSTPFATIFAAVDPPGAGTLLLAARERSGAMRMESATIVAVDPQTSVTLLKTSRLDIATPDFAAPPPVGAALAVPATTANCDYLAPAPFPDGCRLQITLGRVTGPVAFPAGLTGITGLTDTIYGFSRGLPVFAMPAGTIVGIAARGGMIPLPAIAQSAAALAAGLAITLKP